MQGSSTARKATNVTLDPGLLAEARAYGVNLSQAAEAGLRRAVAEAKARAWAEENAQALASSNAYAEEKGLPLARFRQF